jgi:hypothetical protein
MAFEADCEASTVLEALRVAPTPRHPLVWRLEALATRPCATAPRRLEATGKGCRFGQANSKFEIRNSKSPWAANPKSEIRNPKSEIRNSYRR